MTTILVVDDKEAHRRLISDVLQFEGYDTLQADSPSAALLLLKGSRAIDLVTLDFSMPEMLGTELFNRIRTDPDLAHRSMLPVVFITIFPNDPAIRRLGKISVLPKPLDDINDIVKAVKKELALA